jgi:hypothetical protein
MSGETASTEGGEIRLGVFVQLSRYVFGATPKLTGDERTHLLEQDILPDQVLEGNDYDLIIYKTRDFFDGTGFPDETFVSFARELNQGLGERALSEEVRLLHPVPR